MDNWMDVSLMLDFGYMSDNTGDKNIFYVLENTGENLKIKQILWDTDYSFGIGYSSGFAHIPESATTKRKYRREEDYLREKYPDFDRMMAERWFELRKNVFDEENIYSTIDECRKEITVCGAFDREKELWGYYYEDGTDTLETMCKYIEERIGYLDSCHSSALE